jgi:hypothetical protein
MKTLCQRLAKPGLITAPGVYNRLNHVQAIQLDDQEFPKKYGHATERHEISVGDMVSQLYLAVEGRCSCRQSATG